MKLRYKQVPWADWKKVVCLAWREAISAIFGPHSDPKQANTTKRELNLQTTFLSVEDR